MLVWDALEASTGLSQCLFELLVFDTLDLPLDSFLDEPADVDAMLLEDSLVLGGHLA